jgi:SAM-dependent methyltransferase
MIWRLKTLAFQALSHLPFGRSLHAFAQRHVTRSLVPTPSRVGQKLSEAIRYWRFLKQHGLAEALSGGTHVDFGSGWHPTIPFALYCAGIEKQILLDLEPVMRADAVAATAEIFREIAPGLLDRAGLKPVRTLPVMPLENGLEGILSTLGIEYKAPYRSWLKNTKDTVDLVTSTQVLLHIDKPVLLSCFQDIFNALRPGGVFLATIHLHPLYGGLRHDSDAYRHLQYSPEQWARFSSAMMSYTRLKAPDYRELLESVGFELPGWEVTPGRPEDYEALKHLPIHSCFSHYTTDDLAARHVFFAARKPLNG